MKENIKNMISFLVMFVLFILLIGWCGNIECHYTKKAEIIKINDNVVTFKDTIGELWDWEISPKDDRKYTIGAECSLWMYDKHTYSTFDDEIEKIKFK